MTREQLQGLNPEQIAEKLADLGVEPHSAFDRYDKKGKVKRRTLASLLQVPQSELTRLLGVFESSGLVYEFDAINEREPQLRELIETAYAAYGTKAGLTDFFRNPSVAKKSLPNLDKLFRAYGFVPEWDSKTVK